MTLYLFLKYIHVLLAIVAVGANVTYGIWLAMGAREPQQLRVVLQGIRFLDQRVANPAYGLLVVTGLALVAVGDVRLTTPWVTAALVVYIVAVVLGIRGFSPALRRQIQAVESAGPQSEEYRRAAAGARSLGVVFMVLVLVIVFFMVTKPALWG